MKILFLTHYFPPEGNAPASRVHAMARRWVAGGHEVTVITCTPNVPAGKPYAGYANPWHRTETLDGIEVHRVWTLLAANRGAARRIISYLTFMVSATWRALWVSRPDVVVATSPQFFAGWAGVLTSRLRRRPLVLEIRDIWPESIEAVGALGSRKRWLSGAVLRMLELLERGMYRAARHIVTVGDGYAALLRERGVPDAKLTVITNGVEDTQFDPVPADAALRTRAGAGPDDLLVGYIGTVGMAHGLDVMIEAGRLARDRGLTRLRFVVVGDGARRVELEARLAQDDPGNVRFVGLQPKATMPAWLASVDVCLVHLRDTPLFATVLPSKFLEAAAAGKPIILGVRGGIAALAAEHEAAVLVTPESPTELVDAAARLADDLSGRFALSAAARELARSRFRVDVLARAYLTLLESVAHTHGGAITVPTAATRT